MTSFIKSFKTGRAPKDLTDQFGDSAAFELEEIKSLVFWERCSRRLLHSIALAYP
jgi:hypothetical protein